MALNIDEKYTKQVNSIMSKLPQNPFIIDVVGKAIEISYNFHKEDEKMEGILNNTIQIVDFVNDISTPTRYKYHIIAANLLAGVPEKEYEVIDTASGVVADSVKLVTAALNNTGFKDLWVQMNTISQRDMDLMYVVLVNLTSLLECLVTKEHLELADRYILAGLAYIEVSLRKSAITIPNKQYSVYNKFMSILMKNASF